MKVRKARTTRSMRPTLGTALVALAVSTATLMSLNQFEIAKRTGNILNFSYGNSEKAESNSDRTLNVWEVEEDAKKDAPNDGSTHTSETTEEVPQSGNNHSTRNTIRGSLSTPVSGDSSTATVMAMATGYDLKTYQRFVGSLRATGYKGHIILGIHPNPSQNILDYFKKRDVTPKLLSYTNCTYTKDPTEKADIFKKTQCAVPYPDIKIRWSRFPLARDWLADCETCTGPVLIMDARDSIFQLDPFGPGSPPVEGLQVFQEHLNQTTKHWLTEWPIRECKGLQYDEPMLCSGTTIGTREAMLEYLNIMYEEMKVWIEDSKCRFDINGDDQSMHNYLFYAGKLPFAKSIPNREGIVHTVGFEGDIVSKAHVEKMKEEGLDTRTPFPGANGKTWISGKYGLSNDAGLITDFDGSVSRVVHQFDRLRLPYMDWLDTQPWVHDDI